MQLHHSFYFCHFCFLSKKSDDPVDVLVVVFDDRGALQELLLLLGGAGFCLEVGGGQLAEDVGVLTHEETGLDVFFLLLWLYEFLHERIMIINWL